MHLELTLRGQSQVRIHLGLSFLFYPFPVLRTQLALEQLKPQLLFLLLEFPECCQLCFELAIAHLLGSNPAALVALWRIDIASFQLRKEKSVRVLDRLAVPLLRGRNACIRYVEEILKFPRGIKLVEVWGQRSRFQFLETAFEPTLSNPNREIFGKADRRLPQTSEGL
jgi:hypothetical protein